MLSEPCLAGTASAGDGDYSYGSHMGRFMGISIRRLIELDGETSEACLEKSGWRV